jgi:lysozyme family protein
MSASSYDEALSRLLVHEGGYSNHPADPGGPTNFGITLADARAYWKRDATAADVRAMPRAVAREIYRTKYWAALRGNDLPAGVDYAVFDYGVNSGIGRAGKVLRRLVGLADTMSAIDGAVIAAVWRRPPRRLIEAICDERLAFLQSLSTWGVFGNGWGRRVREVRAAALAMAEAKSTAALPTDTASPSSPPASLPTPSPRTRELVPPAPGPDRGMRGRIASLLHRLFHHRNQEEGV